MAGIIEAEVIAKEESDTGVEVGVTEPGIEVGVEVTELKVEQEMLVQVNKLQAEETDLGQDPGTLW